MKKRELPKEEAKINSVVPCHRGAECSWPACAADCDGRPGREAPVPRVVNKLLPTVRSAAVCFEGVKRPCALCLHHELVPVNKGKEHACFVGGLRDLVTGERVGLLCATNRDSGACGPQGRLWEKA